MTAKCRLKPSLSIGFNLFDCITPMLDKSNMDIDRVNELIAKNLQSLLEEKDLKATVWSEKADLSHTTVSDIIKLKTKNPTYKTLLKLAKVAGVDIRRITVGPHYMTMDEDIVKMLDLMSRLGPRERKILLDVGQAHLESQDQSDQE